MKTVNKLKKIIPYTLLTIICLGYGDATKATPPQKKSIKVALLLDTSSSMDGLIEQAKSQLWKIVNELATAKCDGEQPYVKIALYEYGNDRLQASNGYIKKVTSLTDDLDLVSQELFNLRTNGGSELCGQVIQTSLNELEWGNDDKDLKMIFIAGNEEFNQGTVNYKMACNLAKNNDVVVNTIFCGSFETGINSFWKDGANLAEGYYMSISQNSKTVYIPSPYDDRITELNTKLNDTYIHYGSAGSSKKQNQISQDFNASTYGNQNMVMRSISKSSHLYNNSSWDLIDKSQQEDFDIKKVEEKYLPKEMHGMDKQEKLDYIAKKKKEREDIQKEIKQLNIKRNEFVNDQNKEKGTEENQLDAAMIKAIHMQAVKKDFKFAN